MLVSRGGAIVGRVLGGVAPGHVLPPVAGLSVSLVTGRWLSIRGGHVRLLVNIHS